MDLAGLFIESGRVAADVIARPEVARHWGDDSILPGYRVGGLAAHLGRAVATVDNYLRRDAPPDEVALVDAVGYLTTALADHDPLTSDFHAEVRARGEQAAEDGHAVIAQSTREILAELADEAWALDRPLEVLAGIGISLGDYLETRLVELLIHTRDLCDSIGFEPPTFPAGAWYVVARLLAATAIARQGSEAVALGLARADRMPPARAF